LIQLTANWLKYLIKLEPEAIFMNGENTNIKPSPEFEDWLELSKKNIPDFANYLQQRFTMEQAIGYVIAAMNAEGYFDPVDAGGILLTLIKEQFINLKPEEAEEFYFRYIHRVAEEQETEKML
jgi:hypothetical protein